MKYSHQSSPTEGKTPSTSDGTVTNVTPTSKLLRRSSSNVASKSRPRNRPLESRDSPAAKTLPRLASINDQSESPPSARKDTEGGARYSSIFGDGRASNLAQSNRLLSQSERLRLNLSIIVREADERARRTENEVSRRLGERIRDVRYWRNEVGREAENMIGEIRALKMAIAQLERSLFESGKPLQVTEECLSRRKGKEGVDLVQDDVERQLINEASGIKKCQEEMRKVQEEALRQLSANRSAQHALERDLSDKLDALSLDSKCHRLRQSCLQQLNCPSTTTEDNFENTNSVPESWAQYTNDNIIKSFACRAASKACRNWIKQTLDNSNKALLIQWNLVNSTFADQIKEYTDVRNKLQIHLAKISQEIFDLEKCIELLKKCIRDKEAPLKMAQARLATRSLRPTIEACKDPAHNSLLDEVRDIGETTDHVSVKLREAKGALQRLLGAKGALERDLAIKNNSIFVDKEKCMGLRKTLLPVLSMTSN